MTDGLRASSVCVSGLHHAYDTEPVLVDVALDVEAGAFVALLGPSGCGKTTLLRAIAGLERPALGNIWVGDDKVSSSDTWVPPEKRRVGMVFQEWALFPHLSVGANVGYGLDRAARAGTRVGDTLEMVGLGGLGERMPSTLSGGQQQRVALARALAPRPRVLLLDEPFSNLDTSMRVEVRSEVHRLLLELGITAIFVTHDQEEAFVIGDRVAIMNEGRIVQVGTPHEIYTRPASRWAAEFVGEASILRCEAHAGVAVGPFGPFPLEGEHEGSVDVLLRPEQLAVVAGDLAVVEVVEFYGHDAMVFVSIDGQTLRIRTGPEVPVSRGDRVGIEFRSSGARAFAA